MKEPGTTELESLFVLSGQRTAVLHNQHASSQLL